MFLEIVGQNDGQQKSQARPLLQRSADNISMISVNKINEGIIHWCMHTGANPPMYTTTAMCYEGLFSL